MLCALPRLSAQRLDAVAEQFTVCGTCIDEFNISKVQYDDGYKYWRLSSPGAAGACGAHACSCMHVLGNRLLDCAHSALRSCVEFVPAYILRMYACNAFRPTVLVATPSCCSCALPVGLPLNINMVILGYTRSRLPPFVSIARFVKILVSTCVPLAPRSAHLAVRIYICIANMCLFIADICSL